MDKNDELRKEVTAADDTGMFASEEQLAEAETLLPVARLHDALPQGHAAHATIDNLYREITGAKPNRATIEHHVSALRSLPELEATVANWWDDPKTQRVIYDLTQIGL
jgi:hypothetical protein